MSVVGVDDSDSGIILNITSCDNEDYNVTPSGTSRDYNDGIKCWNTCNII